MILKTWPVGENHRGVRFFLPETGLVDACAYGAASRKNPLRGTLQILTAGNVSLWHDRVRDRYRVESFDPRDFYENIRADLDKIEAASLWSEILIKTTTGSEESFRVFALLSSALEILNQSDFTGISRINRLSTQFLWHYLILSGFKPDFSRCGRCSRTLDQSETLFWRGEGDIHCTSCGEPGESRLPPGVKIWMERISGLPLSQSISIGLEERAQTLLLALFCQVIEHLSGSSLKTLPR
jgi:DNA repair protein RecO (recombination protein O)